MLQAEKQKGQPLLLTEKQQEGKGLIAWKSAWKQASKIEQLQTSKEAKQQSEGVLLSPGLRLQPLWASRYFKRLTMVTDWPPDCVSWQKMHCAQPIFHSLQQPPDQLAQALSRLKAQHCLHEAKAINYIIEQHGTALPAGHIITDTSKPGLDFGPEAGPPRPNVSLCRHNGGLANLVTVIVAKGDSQEAADDDTMAFQVKR